MRAEALGATLDAVGLSSDPARVLVVVPTTAANKAQQWNACGMPKVGAPDAGAKAPLRNKRHPRGHGRSTHRWGGARSPQSRGDEPTSAFSLQSNRAPFPRRAHGGARRWWGGGALRGGEAARAHGDRHQGPPSNFSMAAIGWATPILEANTLQHPMRISRNACVWMLCCPVAPATPLS